MSAERWTGSTATLRKITPAFVAIALLALTPLAHAVSPAAGAGTTPAVHYLVFEVQPDGSARAVFGTRVALRTPLRSVDPVRRARLTAPSRDHDHVIARLTDGAGATVFEDVVTVPRWRRGEFHGAGPGRAGEYTIDAHVVPDPAKAFVVRVPVVPGTTLVLDSGALTRAGRFDPDGMEQEARTTARALAPPPPGWTNGDPANRVDLLVLGDGYRIDQASQFASDALTLANNFFNLTPYAEYRNYVNVSTLFTPSAEAGADQPPYDPACTQHSRTQTCCSDSGASARTPTTVSTAFDGTFCSFDVQRLLTVDNTKVLIAAAGMPDWDEIIVLANSVEYGGSGGQFSVASTNTFAVNLAQHEYGHTFTLLADEYADSVPSFPPCSDVGGSFPACEPNVTDETTRSQIKWTRWIAPSQAVPSKTAPLVATDAGLWKGARYQATGMYRQGYNCMMRALFSPFCDVAAEAYALRLYDGGWGIPANGIDTIEPGTEHPSPGAVSVPYPGDTFSATLLGPEAGPDLDVAWYLDGAPVASQSVVTGDVASYALVTTPGPHVLELRVTDVSPIIHPTMRAARTRTWNVTVGPNLCGNAALDSGETCDDGDQAPGDGCSAICRVEQCWACAGLPSVCAPDDAGSCSDGDACTVGEVCSAGSCGGAVPLTSCADGDGCCPSACTFGNDADCPAPMLVSGKKLIVKDSVNPTRRRVDFESRDPVFVTAPGSGLDPVANGVTLQLYNASGTGESVCLSLPSAAGSWRATGNPAHPIFKYKDTAGLHGPCTTATLKDGKQLKVHCTAKIRPISYSLDEPTQGAMAMRVLSGGRDYCTRFGGTLKTDSGTDPPIAGGRGKFSALNAGAPVACPAPPTTCP